jgi:nicotinate-nucleotide pyrophosphorylase (carboxylating)
VSAGADRLVPPDPGLVREVAARALAEDRAGFDVTTQALVPPSQRGRARFVFREPGVVCGLPVAREVFALLSGEVELRALREEGAWVEGGTAVAEASGPLSAILSGERVALNLVQRMSGVATMTRR